MTKRLVWQWSMLWILIIISKGIVYCSWEDQIQEARRIHELDALVKAQPDTAVRELNAVLEGEAPPTLQLVAASHLGALGHPGGVRGLEAIKNKQPVPLKLKIVAQVSLERIRMAGKSPEEKKEVFQEMLTNPEWKKAHLEIMRVTGDLVPLDSYSSRLQQEAPIAYYRRWQESLRGMNPSKRIDVLINRLQEIAADLESANPSESTALCQLLIEAGDQVVTPLLSLLNGMQDKRSILVNDIADILISVGDQRALPVLKALASSPDPSVSNKVAGHIPWLEVNVSYPHKYIRLYEWYITGH